MRQSQMLIPTLRHVSEAENISHHLMLRAGYIRQLASGIYTYLPLGYRVLRKVENIVRKEMEKIGAQELFLPVLHPAEIWKETGRYANYGPELIKLEDRHGRQFVAGPTHEEVITDLIRREVQTYKKLPMSVYQIQTKFRDERRPRSGLLRGREFLMKDAYSFHENQESLNYTYDQMYKAYVQIFSCCGLAVHAVEADAGAIGGKGTHEFIALSDVGEDTIVYCPSCGYAANLEMAEIKAPIQDTTEQSNAPLEKKFTPNKRSIKELSEYLGLSSEQIVKSLLYLVDELPVLFLIRGDHELNEVKIKNFFNASSCQLADEDTIYKVTGVQSGFLGPIDLKEKVNIYADPAVVQLKDMVVGANEVDFHFVNVQLNRDFRINGVADLRNITDEDCCPRCEGEIHLKRGIEVGHLFKLGTRYSKAMSATFLDATGEEKPFIMGCYGIGISRLLATIIEQHHDENGIIWPTSVSPFHVHLVVINQRDLNQVNVAELLYLKLNEMGIEVLYDDRLERAGVKFKDSDLLGIPVRINVGAKASEGIIEIKMRRRELSEFTIEGLLKELPLLIKKDS